MDKPNPDLLRKAIETANKKYAIDLDRQSKAYQIWIRNLQRRDKPDYVKGNLTEYIIRELMNINV